MGVRTGRCGALSVLALLAWPLAAQELVTDRPDFTESAESVPRGRFQLEGGATHEEGEEGETWSFGEALLRVGLSERLELRLEPGSWVESEGENGTASGLEDAALGLKLEGPHRPGSSTQVALILATSLPTGEEELGSDDPHPEAVLAASWDLTPRLGLGANLGGGEEEDEGRELLAGRASLALGIDLGGGWGAFVEGFGLYPEGGGSEHFFDAGLTRLVGEDLQVDVRAGHEVGDGGEGAWFAGAGLARRW